MNQEFQIRTAACPDYQRLLQECESAMVAWKERSEEITQLGLQGKSAGDGLQRLQAEYARAYHRLERHADSCGLCGFRRDLRKSGQANTISSSTRKELPA